MLEGKEFLKLTGERLGPTVPEFLRLVLEGRGRIRGEGGHLPTSPFQKVSPQVPHVSDFIFQIAAAMEIKPYNTVHSTMIKKKKKKGGKGERKDRTKQEKTLSY